MSRINATLEGCVQTEDLSEFILFLFFRSTKQMFYYCCFPDINLLWAIIFHKRFFLFTVQKPNIKIIINIFIIIIKY